MLKEKNICSGYNKPKGLTGKLHSACYREYYKCNCKASIFENDKWWCKKHAPSKIKEREEKNGKLICKKYEKILNGTVRNINFI